MEYYNNIQAVEFRDISDIICAGTFNSLCSRGQVERLRRAHYGYSALYSVESFPLKYRKAIKEKFSEEMKEDATTKLLDAEEIKTDMQAVKFYSEYVLTDGRHLPSDKQTEYTNNASILNRCKEIYQISCERRNRTSGTRIKKGEFWKKVSDKLTKLQEDFPNSLPTDTMRLQKKYNDYQKRGYEAMISGKFMNKNNAKILGEDKESIIITLISDRRNLQNTQIAVIYNEVAKKMGWKEIREGTVANWREKYTLESYAGRYGENKFRADKTMQVKRQRPTMPMLYWTADSWDVELLYQKTKEDKSGHNVTTYHNRLTVCVILDTSINYPVGYAIGEYETPDLIRQALKDAVNHTKALFGERYIVNEFQSDRYAIKNLQEAYRSITENFVPARAHNAKAKVIEPYFRYLNDTYCHFANNWSGYGVTSRKELQPNGNVPTALKKMFPTMEECAEQIAKIIECEREKKYLQFTQGFEKLPQDKKITISNEQYLLQFGKDNKRTNKLEGNGLNITISGKKYHYDCFDTDFRRYSYEDWTVKYDEDDMTRVLATNKDNTLQFMLEEKRLQPMALAERKEGDREELQRVFDYNKSIERHVMDVICSAQDRTRRFLLDNAGKLDETLSKLMITDSRGQHKDQRNKNRMISDKEIEAIDYKPVDFNNNVEEEEEYLASLY
ncbi:MAG: hypothetical protein IJ180_09470 [Bacteroidales bacterium]|nr:hypothetical protein [Bacteroidales bacterium]